jgi:hypothetical protein
MDKTKDSRQFQFTSKVIIVAFTELAGTDILNFPFLLVVFFKQDFLGHKNLMKLTALY